MPTCTTQETVPDSPLVYNLILPIPDTDFRDFIAEVTELSKKHPEIVESIEKDLDENARKKKKLRIEDKKFADNKTLPLSNLYVEEVEHTIESLKIETGRPRMSGELVFLFIMIRGFLGGSLASKPSRRFLHESMSLYGYLQDRGLKIPAVTTIIENVNLVSQKTLDSILDKQIKLIFEEYLDDFKQLTIDSTSVKANSSWPTDARILTGLLTRSNNLGQKLHVFGLQDFQLGRIPNWLDEMDKLEFQICLVAGKAKSKGKLKTHYRKLLRRGYKTITALTKEFTHFKSHLRMEMLSPSRRVLLQRILDQIESDISDAERVIEYADNRVFKNIPLPSAEKVLSLSDISAAYIKKGNRNPVIGYKPQLVRSKNGFVPWLTVPEGNAADSAEFVPAIRESMMRTGVIADLVSTDDGYASAKGRKEILEMGVSDISISGAKGKKITNNEDWQTTVYRDARRNRSAVESLMFTIKDGFNFEELGRCGINAVRAELTEKVLAYNCCRIILIRKRQREEMLKKAA
ncbi:transposase [candidate division KSB1 bacterium]|nr:transposase [candidate division KSB1 bacterium]